MPVLPDSRPFRYLHEVDPMLAEKALANLSAPARLVWLYTAVRPIGTLISRADMAGYFDPGPARHLEEALRELVDGGWLVPEPPGCPGCCIDGLFRLAVDMPEPAAEPVPDGLLLASPLPSGTGMVYSGCGH
jgi:hypothetical protein